MMRIYPLKTGVISVPKSTYLFLTGYGETVTVPIIMWYIEGAEKTIVVDNGYDDAGRVTREHRLKAKRTEEHTIEKSLMHVGLKPADVDLVINTHLHFDHAGCNKTFKNAKFVVQEKELQHAWVPCPPVASGYHRPDFDGLNFELVDGDVEVAGGIKLVSTPGHTPGHSSVLVETEVGTVAIAGDAISCYFGCENEIIPGVNSNVEDSWHSLKKLKRIAKIVLPGHEPKVFEKRAYP